MFRDPKKRAVIETSLRLIITSIGEKAHTTRPGVEPQHSAQAFMSHAGGPHVRAMTWHFVDEVSAVSVGRKCVSKEKIGCKDRRAFEVPLRAVVRESCLQTCGSRRVVLAAIMVLGRL
ncbi:hypothetical protein M3J09_002750 [Ascochyta lentis]